jgi:hypothetical protein
MCSQPRVVYFATHSSGQPRAFYFAACDFGQPRACYLARASACCRHATVLACVKHEVHLVHLICQTAHTCQNMKCTWCTSYVKLHLHVSKHEVHLMHLICQTALTRVKTWSALGAPHMSNCTSMCQNMKCTWCASYVKLHLHVSKHEVHMVRLICQTALTCVKNIRCTWCTSYVKLHLHVSKT